MLNLAGFSHLLKSPLASLHAYLSLLKYKHTDSDLIDYVKIDSYIFSLSHRVEFVSACFDYLQKPTSSRSCSLSVFAESFNGDVTELPDIQLKCSDDLLAVNSVFSRLVSSISINYSATDRSLTIVWSTPSVFSAKDMQYALSLLLSVYHHAGLDAKSKTSSQVSISL